jgi:hypothetical protein
VSVIFSMVFILPSCILTLYMKRWCVPFKPSSVINRRVSVHQQQ